MPKKKKKDPTLAQLKARHHFLKRLTEELYFLEIREIEEWELLQETEITNSYLKINFIK